jgi:hypothetical protein
MSKPATVLSAVLLLVFGLASQPARAQGPDDILWLDAAHTEPYVIPESAFSRLDWSDPSKTDLSALPLTEEQRAYLRNAVEARRNAPKPPSCRSYPEGIGDDFGFNPPRHSQTLADLVHLVDTAVVGQVSRLVPAWDPVTRRPNTRVFLSVVEVVKPSQAKTLGPGDEVSFLLPFGDITIGGTRDCLLPGADVYVPRLSDRVLVLGVQELVINPLNFYCRFFFELTDEKVMTRGNLLLRSDQPVQLADLEAELQRSFP